MTTNNTVPDENAPSAPPQAPAVEESHEVAAASTADTPFPATAAASPPQLSSGSGQSAAEQSAYTSPTPAAAPPEPQHSETATAEVTSPLVGTSPPAAASDSPAAASTPPSPPPQPVPTVPRPPLQQDLSRIAQDLQIRKVQVEQVVQLLDAGNTVVFIARYRRQQTGGLNEETIRRIQERLRSLRAFAERKQTILKTIATQGRLSPQLADAILAAENLKRLEDLFLPYKPRKKSLANEARDKGLEPLAFAIWSRDEAVLKLDEVLPGMVDEWKQLHEPADVLAGAKHILAELVADHAEVRGALRAFLWDTAVLRAARIETLPVGKGKEFQEYFNFREAIRTIPPHRVLAVNRGEREQIIRVFLEADSAAAVDLAAANLPIADHPHREILLLVVKDAVERLILPSLEKEIRRDLTDRAQEHAIQVFARNLRGLLMQPPLRNRRVLAIDPGLRTGCKLAALDEAGNLLEDAVIFPHQPKRELETAKRKLEQLIRKHQLSVIALGNGTACRETEEILSNLIAEFANRRLRPKPTVTDEPPVVSETPAITRDAPAITSETPAITSENPAIIGQPPAITRESPAIIGQTPAMTSRSPGVTEAEAPAPPSVTLPPPPVEPLTEVIALPAPLGEVATTSLAAVNLDLPGESEVPKIELAATVEPIAAPAPAASLAEPAPPTIDLTGLPDPPDNLAYVIVNEAGAAEYSNNPAAREEFPNLEPSIRAAISIGRRLQDPLAELVKIDPQSFGVGLYQHDLKHKLLRETLEAVIDSCVNHVGADLNTAGVHLLKHIAGLNKAAASEIVQHRQQHGPFRTLAQLRDLPLVGEARYLQAAGFLRIQDGDEPLDRTTIHPEQYDLARKILADLGFSPRELGDPARHDALRAKLNTVDLEATARKFNLPPAALDELFRAFARTGRDPRDDMPPPILKTRMLKLEDVKPGMELKGTVLNVVPFGAFIDIGTKESGLVHISQLANRYIKSPYDVVSVGDVVRVWVLEVKAEEKKISLTMIPPARERAPEPPPEPRVEPERRPPRGTERGQPRGPGPRPPRSRRFDLKPAETPSKEAAPAPTPAPPPRRGKPAPIPKLTEEKKTGKAALNTFGELFAFFKSRAEKEAPPAEPPVAAEPPPAAPEVPAKSDLPATSDLPAKSEMPAAASKPSPATELPEHHAEPPPGESTTLQ